MQTRTHTITRTYTYGHYFVQQTSVTSCQLAYHTNVAHMHSRTDRKTNDVRRNWDPSNKHITHSWCCLQWFWESYQQLSALQSKVLHLLCLCTLTLTLTLIQIHRSTHWSALQVSDLSYTHSNNRLVLNNITKIHKVCGKVPVLRIYDFLLKWLTVGWFIREL